MKQDVLWTFFNLLYNKAPGFQEVIDSCKEYKVPAGTISGKSKKPKLYEDTLFYAVYGELRSKKKNDKYITGYLWCINDDVVDNMRLQIEHYNDYLKTQGSSIRKYGVQEKKNSYFPLLIPKPSISSYQSDDGFPYRKWFWQLNLLLLPKAEYYMIRIVDWDCTLSEAQSAVNCDKDTVRSGIFEADPNQGIDEHSLLKYYNLDYFNFLSAYSYGQEVPFPYYPIDISYQEVTEVQEEPSQEDEEQPNPAYAYFPPAPHSSPVTNPPPAQSTPIQDDTKPQSPIQQPTSKQQANLVGQEPSDATTLGSEDSEDYEEEDEDEQEPEPKAQNNYQSSQPIPMPKPAKQPLINTPQEVRRKASVVNKIIGQYEEAKAQYEATQGKEMRKRIQAQTQAFLNQQNAMKQQSELTLHMLQNEDVTGQFFANSNDTEKIENLKKAQTEANKALYVNAAGKKAYPNYFSQNNVQYYNLLYKLQMIEKRLIESQSVSAPPGAMATDLGYKSVISKNTLVTSDAFEDTIENIIRQTNICPVLTARTLINSTYRNDADNAQRYNDTLQHFKLQANWPASHIYCQQIFTGNVSYGHWTAIAIDFKLMTILYADPYQDHDRLQTIISYYLGFLNYEGTKNYLIQQHVQVYNDAFMDFVVLNKESFQVQYERDLTFMDNVGIYNLQQLHKQLIQQLNAIEASDSISISFKLLQYKFFLSNQPHQTDSTSCGIFATMFMRMIAGARVDPMLDNANNQNFRVYVANSMVKGSFVNLADPIDDGYRDLQIVPATFDARRITIHREQRNQNPDQPRAPRQQRQPQPPKEPLSDAEMNRRMNLYEKLKKLQYKEQQNLGWQLDVSQLSDELEQGQNDVKVYELNKSGMKDYTKIAKENIEKNKAPAPVQNKDMEEIPQLKQSPQQDQQQKPKDVDTSKDEWHDYYEPPYALDNGKQRKIIKEERKEPWYNKISNPIQNPVYWPDKLTDSERKWDPQYPKYGQAYTKDAMQRWKTDWKISSEEPLFPYQEAAINHPSAQELSGDQKNKTQINEQNRKKKLDIQQEEWNDDVKDYGINEEEFETAKKQLKEQFKQGQYNKKYIESKYGSAEPDEGTLSYNALADMKEKRRVKDLNNYEQIVKLNQLYKKAGSKHRQAFKQYPEYEKEQYSKNRNEQAPQGWTAANWKPEEMSQQQLNEELQKNQIAKHEPVLKEDRKEWQTKNKEIQFKIWDQAQNKKEYGVDDPFAGQSKLKRSLYSDTYDKYTGPEEFREKGMKELEALQAQIQNSITALSPEAVRAHNLKKYGTETPSQYQLSTKALEDLKSKAKKQKDYADILKQYQKSKQHEKIDLYKDEQYTQEEDQKALQAPQHLYKVPFIESKTYQFNNEPSTQEQADFYNKNTRAIYNMIPQEQREKKSYEQFISDSNFVPYNTAEQSAIRGSGAMALVNQPITFRATTTIPNYSDAQKVIIRGQIQSDFTRGMNGLGHGVFRD